MQEKRGEELDVFVWELLRGGRNKPGERKKEKKMSNLHG